MKKVYVVLAVICDRSDIHMDIMGMYLSHKEAVEAIEEDYNETCFELDQAYADAGPEMVAKDMINRPDFKYFRFDGTAYTWITECIGVKDHCVGQKDLDMIRLAFEQTIEEVKKNPESKLVFG